MTQEDKGSLEKSSVSVQEVDPTRKIPQKKQNTKSSTGQIVKDVEPNDISPSDSLVEPESKKETPKNPKKSNSRGCIYILLVFLGILFVASLCVTAPFALMLMSDASTNKLQEGATDDMIAVIDVNGVITSTDQSSFFGGAIGASEGNLVSLLDDALNDESIDAIILRIESPGGEAVASDIIARKVLAVRESKKVVAYSATTAASGGYMIASAADKFVVHPGVMTGSIGVILQTTNLDGLYEKLGIRSVTIKSDEFKDTEELFENPDGEQMEIFQGIVDESYDMFVDLIVEGRGMNRDEVVRLGDGRIYTGTQAVDNGLADHTGYFDKAIEVTEEIAGLEDATVIEYSYIPSFGEMFFGTNIRNIIESRLPKENYFGVYYLPDLNK